MAASDATSSSSSYRRLLLPLGTMLAAGAIIVGSGADFTSTSTSPASVVTAGAFTQSNSAEDAAVFTMATVAPGDTTTGTVTVTNTGDFAGDFTLVEEDVTTTFPTGALDLVVTDVTVPDAVVPVYSGDLGSLVSNPLTIAAGQARTYEFVVTFDETAGDDAQGDSASAVYTWKATQSD